MYCLRLNESQSAEEHWLYFCAGAQLCASTLFVLYSPAALIFNEMYFIPLKMANKCSRPSVIGNRGAHCNFTVKATHINASSSSAVSSLAAVLLKHIFKHSVFITGCSSEFI